MGVLVADASGTPIYANEECLRLLGRGVLPAGGRRPGEVYQTTVAGSDEPYPTSRTPLQRALEGEATRVDDMEVRHPEGPVPLYAGGVPVMGDDGQVLFAVAYFGDASGQGPTALTGAGTDAEAVFLGLFDQEIHSVALLSPDGTLMAANRRPFKISGWRREDAMGRPLWETGWWAGSRELQEQLRAALGKAAAGHPVVEESPYFVASGEQRISLRALSPIRGPGGEIRNILLVAHDVTDLRRAEREARRLAAIVEGSVDFIALADGRNRIQYLNPAGRELVGLTPETSLPETLEAYLTEEGRGRARDEAIPALAQTGFWRGECQLRHFGTGELIDVSMSATILPDPGEEAGVAFICQDLRERKRVEAALVEAERARAAAEAARDKASRASTN